MTNYCAFCGTPGTNKCLVLGESWIDFCDPCGDKHMLHNDKGESKTVREVFDLNRSNSKEAA